MPKRLLPTALILFALLLMSSTNFAQINTPLIAYFNGIVYQQVGESLVPYTSCQPDEQINAPLIASPDGKGFIMLTLPRVIQKALEELGGFGGMPLGANFWLCDTASNTARRIFVQPGADDPFEVDADVPSLRDVESNPVWSPDGKRIAWVSFDTIADVTSLIVFDPASGVSSETVVDVPPPMGMPLPPDIFWGDDAIFFIVFTLNEDTFAAEEHLYIFDLESSTMTEQFLLAAGGETDDFIVERLLAYDTDGTQQLALRYFQAGWVLVDLSTGEQQPMGGLPALYNPYAPEGLSLLVDIDFDFNYNWQIADSDSEQFIGYPPARVALSPDGTRFALADSVLRIHEAGEVVQIQNSDGFADDFNASLLWGVRQYRVVEGGSIAAPAPPACPGAQASRLKAGAGARVIEATVPNNVRSQATTASELVGQLPGGSTFLVLEGPECSDGYAWFLVEYGTLRGWTVEGSADEYWLEPAEA